MCQLYDGTQVGTDTVIRGVIYKHCHCIRIVPNRRLHLLQAHPQRDSQPAVHIGIHVYRLRAAEDQGIDGASVYISGHDDLISPLAAGQNHALHRGCGTSHHEKRVGRAESLRRQLLRLTDHRDRMAEIIKRLHGININPHTFFSQKLHKFRVSFSVLMSRNIKGHDPHFSETFQRLINRRPFLL